MKRLIVVLLGVGLLANARAAAAGLGSSPGPIDDIQSQNVCGPLALASAAGAVGRPESFGRIFELLPPTGEPRTLSELQAAATKLGLATRAVRWRRGYPLSFSSPAIIRLDPSSDAGIGHFVVVLRVAGDSAQILDLPHPATWIPCDRLWELWDGIALHIAATEAGLPQKRPAYGRLIVSVLAIAAGLSSLLISCLPHRGARSAQGGGGATGPEPDRRLRRWPFLLSAIIPAVLLAPSLGGWGGGHPSLINRRPIESFPAYQSLTVEARELDASPRRVTATYRLHNRSSRPALIERVSSSCGCAVPTLVSHRIPVGGSVELSVGVQPMKGQSREFTIRIQFREPKGYAVELPGTVSVVDAVHPAPAGG